MGYYPAFKSIPRLHREVTITEKLDGTNGLIAIDEHSFGESAVLEDLGSVAVVLGSEVGEDGLPLWETWVRSGSRNRWITPDADNHGFAKWVYENRASLVADLGCGMHYGEWWGSGIQRGYGLTKGEKRFSLFNVARWTEEVPAERFSVPTVKALTFTTPGLGVVPVMKWKSPGDQITDSVSACLGALRLNGSLAAPGFSNPEGIVLYHHAANTMFKVTLEDDEVPKRVAAHRSKGSLRQFAQGAKEGTAA